MQNQFIGTVLAADRGGWQINAPYGNKMMLVDRNCPAFGSLNSGQTIVAEKVTGDTKPHTPNFGVRFCAVHPITRAELQNLLRGNEGFTYQVLIGALPLSLQEEVKKLPSLLQYFLSMAWGLSRISTSWFTRATQEIISIRPAHPLDSAPQAISLAEGFHAVFNGLQWEAKKGCWNASLGFVAAPTHPELEDIEPTVLKQVAELNEAARVRQEWLRHQETLLGQTTLWRIICQLGGEHQQVMLRYFPSLLPVFGHSAVTAFSVFRPMAEGKEWQEVQWF